MNEKQIEKLKNIFNTYEYDNESFNPVIDLSILDNIFEFSYVVNNTINNIEISLIGEIDELFYKGYTKEEIFELLLKAFPLCEELDCEENYYLMKSATKLIKIRYKLFIIENIKRSQEKMKLKQLDYHSLKSGKYRKSI